MNKILYKIIVFLSIIILVSLLSLIILGLKVVVFGWVVPVDKIDLEVLNENNIENISICEKKNYNSGIVVKNIKYCIKDDVLFITIYKGIPYPKIFAKNENGRINISYDVNENNINKIYIIDNNTEKLIWTR